MRLLIVEDKDSFRALLVKALEGSAWDVVAAPGPEEAIRALESAATEAMVTDLRLPGMSGLELIKRARRFSPSMRIMLMSAFGEPSDIVEAMHYGADDFLQKPFDLDVFMARLDKLRALSLAPPPDGREPWVMASPAMKTIEKYLRAVAESSKPVLFAGQAGTGRTRAARRLHFLRHPVAPFRSMPAMDVSIEMLGGPMLAGLQGGGLLIKGLEALPPAVLPALVSAICAHPEICWMGTCVSPSLLPEPLSSTMGALCISLLPLADRREDILPIFHHYLGEACRREGCIVPMVDNKAEMELLGRPWPGNAAELVWVASEAARACPRGLLKELPMGFDAAAGHLLLPRPSRGSLSSMLQGIAISAEKNLIEEAMGSADGDAGRAAEALGISLKSLIHKLKEHGVALG